MQDFIAFLNAHSTALNLRLLPKEAFQEIEKAESLEDLQKILGDRYPNIKSENFEIETMNRFIHFINELIHLSPPTIAYVLSSIYHDEIARINNLSLERFNEKYLSDVAYVKSQKLPKHIKKISRKFRKCRKQMELFEE